ncbi:MAG: alginate lyase [Pedobacter sp.]|nr:MAG: alginate lyase [Pedobacter sp.]
MRKFVITVLILVASFSGFTQIVSLNQKEISTLKLENSSTEKNKKLYHSFEKLASSFLLEQPNPIDTIRTEGLLKGNPKKVKTQQALADMNKMYTLALQYRLNGNKQYLDKSLSFLIAWAKINQPNGNPIDDTNLDKAVEAYDLIKDLIGGNDKALIENWLKETALAEINSKRMQAGRGTAINNWNAHRLKVVGEIGYTLNDKALIDWTIEKLKQHININLHADGTSLDFKERDAMHYHIYDLEPMLELAIMIDRAKGENFYTYQSVTGSSIQKSVDWLIPYMKGEKQHEEYVHTTVKFDRDRAKNNEPGFAPGTMFEPKLALPVLRLSVYFDRGQIDLLNTLDGNASFQQLIDQVKRDSK